MGAARPYMTRPTTTGPSRPPSPRQAQSVFCDREAPVADAPVAATVIFFHLFQLLYKFFL